MRIKLDQVGRALVGETWTEPATQGIGNVGGKAQVQRFGVLYPRREKESCGCGCSGSCKGCGNARFLLGVRSQLDHLEWRG